MFPGPPAALTTALSSAGILNGPSVPGYNKINKRTASISIGGPPKAPLGGPARKVTPVVPTPSQADNAKIKKIIVKLPVEQRKEDDDDETVYSLWSRQPLDNLIICEEAVIPANVQTIEPYSFNENLPGILPEIIDVYLPGKVLLQVLRSEFIA